jgi:ribonuclease BN (tRNA processing enzyme)
MHILICGSGVGRFESPRAGAGVLIGDDQGFILFDCGPGVPLRVAEVGVQYSLLRAVFISHLHFDHVQGLADLITQCEATNHPVPPIYGPVGIEEYVDEAHKWSNYQFANRKTIPNNQISVSQIKPNIPYKSGQFTITALDVPHSLEIESYSYKLSVNEQTIIYSGDKPFDSKGFSEFALNCDILIHEAYSIQALNNHMSNGTEERAKRIKEIFPHSHTNGVQVGLIAQSINTKKLVLTHLLPTETESDIKSEIRQHFQGELIYPHDRMDINV